ncbi:hypothetical protein RhiirA5_435218 [Rhizophagus irregularis]|uniref:RRM domain-containing protein n=1 Tax=Rhizophagus irregularis TaxID=588596 RepID=A0A2N0NNQ5_9GLOM|nr:hypothetical protein RhiirA5_435218 [Rhizophagus irregularis]
MTTPPAPSVINPDIPPPPCPDTSAPSGDRPLSPTNTAGMPNKCSHTVSDDAMNVDITSPSAPASNLISTIPPGLPVNRVPVITQPPPTNTSLDDAAAIKSSPSRFHAAAYLRDTPVAFKEKFTTNRAMCDKVDRALSQYSSYGSRAHCEGSGNNKRILVFFFVQDDHTACVQSPCADLLDLVFTLYLPADARHSDEEKSLFVTDIPLFLNEIQIRQTFSRYGDPYAYLNFASFESLEAAKELTIAFRNKGLTWHSPDEAKNLCHVCGRHGCSPSPIARTSHSEASPSQRKSHANAQLGSNFKEIAKQLKDLDEKVNWMEYSITDHDYCIKELESMMNYDGPRDDSPSYVPNSYSNDAGWDYHQDIDDNNNNNSSFSSTLANPNFSIMDTSPDASFFTLNPNSIFSSRHAPLPNRVNLGGSPNDSSRLCQEISSVSHTQQNLSNHMMGGSQGLRPPDSALNLQSLSPSSPTQIFDTSLINLIENLTFLIFYELLPGRQNVFIIGAYIPPSSGLNNRLISEYHSTLISWITAACSTGAHVLLEGDLNAEFDSYLKNILDLNISSPVNSLFRYLYSHQFDDLCAFDSTSSLLPLRLRFRTEFNIHAALPEQKILFIAEVDSGLKKFIPLNEPQAIPFELQPIVHLSHKLDHYISSLFNKFSISDLYSSWNQFFPSFYNDFIDLFPDQNVFIDVLPTPITIYSVFISSHLHFSMFLKKF